MTIRALFISTMWGYPSGGSERLWSATARAALDAGWNVTMSTRAWPQKPHHIVDLIDAGAQWEELPSPEQVDLEATAFPAVLRQGVDVVCVSQGSTYDFLGFDALCAALREWGGPYVVLCRFNDDEADLTEQQRQSGRDFFARARHVGFAARRNMETAARQLRMSMPNAGVIQSPIQLPETNALPWPSSRRPVFACVARLDIAYKGQDLLIDCLASGAWPDRDWRLELHGEGPDRELIDAAIVNRRLEDRISVHGHTGDVLDVWREAHLSVVPSRAEGTPQALIESMTCARPSVCTDVGGIAEWVVNGECGFVAERPTASALADALERAWKQRDDWHVLGLSARNAALSRVDPLPQQRLLRWLEEVA